VEIKDTISSGLLELYVLGMASEQETAEVHALVKKYPEVAAEIEAIESGLQTYAKLYAAEPGSSVKERIFSEINTVSQKNTIQTTDPG
jgi:anti-sigma-K factor RskA